MRHLFQYLLGGSVLLSGCGPDIDAKREQWEAKAPGSYVVSTCGTGFNLSAGSLYAVEDGRVLAVEQRIFPDGDWVPLPGAAEPIASLFDAADNPGDCDLSIDFDAAYSYPTELYFDCGEEGDGERVACFVPDSVDLEACRSATTWEP